MMKFQIGLVFVAISVLAACGTSVSSSGGTSGGEQADSGAVLDAGAVGSDAVELDSALAADSAQASQDVPVAADGGAVAQDSTAGSDAGGAADASVSVDGGAAVDAGSPPAGSLSCLGHCGEYMKESECHCDEACVTYKDCCKDYDSLCTCSKDTDCKSTDPCQLPKCGPKGGCVTVSKCNDDNYCTDDSCDPATGTCSSAPKKDGSYCSDNNVCTTGDACKAGKCLSTGAAKDGGSCSDGNSCTTGDSCKAGKCQPGTSKVCDDQSVCTADSCDPKSGCKYAPTNDGKGCDDSNDCTDSDVCGAGKCKGKVVAEGTVCDDGKPCTKDTKCTKLGSCTGTKLPEGTPCDDENLCTSDDKCSLYGSCFGSAKDCDDDNPCTMDSCEKVSGKCQHKNKADGASCSDGKSCTTGDSCMGGACQGKVKKDGESCTDDNTCTKDDSCTAGKCAGVVDTSKNGKTCSDSNPCTKGDVCNEGACHGSPDGDKCDDANPCTLDVCKKVSSYTSECENKALPDGDKCDDGDSCSTPDLCLAGKCTSKPVCTYKTVLEESFACGKNDGWVFAPAASKTVSGWAIDATPAIPAPKSPKCSLNMNNGTNYDDAQPVKATATSKEIALSATELPFLTFWSYDDVESAVKYDLRKVIISDDGFAKSMKEVLLDNGKDKKVWVQVKVDLSQFKGKKVKIRFDFNSKDTYNNKTAGWFIDDLKIENGTIKP